MNGMKANINKVNAQPKTKAKMRPTPKLAMFCNIVPIRMPVAWEERTRWSDQNGKSTVVYPLDIGCFCGETGAQRTGIVIWMIEVGHFLT